MVIIEQVDVLFNQCMKTFDAVRTCMDTLSSSQRRERDGQPPTLEELRTCISGQTPGSPRLSILSFKGAFHGRGMGQCFILSASICMSSLLHVFKPHDAFGVANFGVIPQRVVCLRIICPRDVGMGQCTLCFDLHVFAATCLR